MEEECAAARDGGHGAWGGNGDMMGIHALFAHRDQIRRTVTQIPGGVRTTTESDDPAVVAQLREHVQSMYARLEEGLPINARDPLFAAIFANADKIRVKIENTEQGLTVTETSDDPKVVDLVRLNDVALRIFRNRNDVIGPVSGIPDEPPQPGALREETPPESVRRQYLELW